MAGLVEIKTSWDFKPNLFELGETTRSLLPQELDTTNYLLFNTHDQNGWSFDARCDVNSSTISEKTLQEQLDTARETAKAQLDGADPENKDSYAAFQSAYDALMAKSDPTHSNTAWTPQASFEAGYSFFYIDDHGEKDGQVTNTPDGEDDGGLLLPVKFKLTLSRDTVDPNKLVPQYGLSMSRSEALPDDERAKPTWAASSVANKVTWTTDLGYKGYPAYESTSIYLNTKSSVTFPSPFADQSPYGAGFRGVWGGVFNTHHQGVPYSLTSTGEISFPIIFVTTSTNKKGVRFESVVNDDVERKPKTEKLGNDSVVLKKESSDDTTPTPSTPSQKKTKTKDGSTVNDGYTVGVKWAVAGKGFRDETTSNLDALLGLALYNSYSPWAVSQGYYYGNRLMLKSISADFLLGNSLAVTPHGYTDNENWNRDYLKGKYTGGRISLVAGHRTARAFPDFVKKVIPPKSKYNPLNLTVVAEVKKSRESGHGLYDDGSTEAPFEKSSPLVWGMFFGLSTDFTGKRIW